MTCNLITSILYFFNQTVVLLFFIDPAIGDFTDMPDSFLGLQKSCSDSDPYDNFTLVCTASKPALVIPTLEVIWLHNGTEHQGVVTYNSEGTYVINTLNFPKTFVNDSGTYSCLAKLFIPDSPDITLIKNINVILKCKWNFVNIALLFIYIYSY